MGSWCLFTRHQALKMGVYIFTGYVLKVRITIIQN